MEDNYYQTSMLKDKLQEEVNRFRKINLYTQKLYLNEQDALPPEEDPMGEPPVEDPTAPEAPVDDPMADPVDDEALPEDETEELDITDLVNMTQSIKNDLDDNRSENDMITSKMDSVFQQFDTLKSKLDQMDTMMQRIDSLSKQIEDSKPPTPEEQLNMRSLDSYPYNEKPVEFFNNKKAEMEKSGKNEYVLTKNEVENYAANQIRDSFADESQEEEEEKKDNRIGF